ncbi:cation:proton antiporter [Xylella taiwanensis]|uniref:cation:proton antiporter n=1 Tax=Xylella taiwanensis TaxID=1444770 RepID=UPI001E53B432|nr:cation:proton antiporter [Xylella taiwanensis]MCD8464713.1 cation:proton antiporter [Xylella taiwanensis]UFS50888.1 cation:proton antiporter [Xylella taiwanensis]
MFSGKAGLLEASLFLGTSVALTTFTMLTCIIHEPGLTTSSLGTMALTAGAFDDAAAWCVLAIVLASFNGSWSYAYLAIGSSIAYALFMLWIGHHALQHLMEKVDPAQPLGTSKLVVVLVLFCHSAWAMDASGIHAVFRGFILGVYMPSSADRNSVRVAVAVRGGVPAANVLHLFRPKNRAERAAATKILLAGIVVLAVSLLGKGVACWGAARLSGENHHKTIAIGALLNTRGLMELMIINIGLQADVIEQGLFSILC